MSSSTILRALLLALPITFLFTAVTMVPVEKTYVARQGWPLSYSEEPTPTAGLCLGTEGYYDAHPSCIDGPIKNNSHLALNFGFWYCIAISIACCVLLPRKKYSLTPNRKTLQRTIIVAMAIIAFGNIWMAPQQLAHFSLLNRTDYSHSLTAGNYREPSTLGLSFSLLVAGIAIVVALWTYRSPKYLMQLQLPLTVGLLVASSFLYLNLL